METALRRRPPGFRRTLPKKEGFFLIILQGDAESARMLHAVARDCAMLPLVGYIGSGNWIML